MDKATAAKEIAVLVNNALTAINEAEKLANEHSLDFFFGPAYGMGGTYYGKGSEDVPDYVDGYSGQKFGWAASSQSCWEMNSLAVKQLASLVAEIELKIEAARLFAEQNKLEFDFSYNEQPNEELCVWDHSGCAF